jgi:hydroxymethylpyrimidine pyrophosphatase-like HAD family hydrolase
VNKGTGLSAGLAALGLSPRECVAVGDAENDHALLAEAGLGAAVSNALPALRDDADVVLRGRAALGVEELIDALLRDDLAGLAGRAWR